MFRFDFEMLKKNCLDSSFAIKIYFRCKVLNDRCEFVTKINVLVKMKLNILFLNSLKSFG